MTIYATDTDLRAYAVGLTLPADVSGALAQGNHWVTRQVERADLTLTGGAIMDARYAACAYALSVMAANGQVTVTSDAVAAVQLGPLKIEYPKTSAPALPDFLLRAHGHLSTAGLDTAREDQVEIATRPRRRW